jgi:hypothetical protein
MGVRVTFVPWVVGIAVLSACGFPRPARIVDDGGISDGASCVRGQALRCEGSDLVSCGGDDTGEVREGCALGCSPGELRCRNIDPSNGLAVFLDAATSEPDLDLGTSATMNTNDGTVMAGGKSIVVRSALLAQTSAPTILVFIVHSLVANDVMIAGSQTDSKAFAIVSDGDIRIGGVFAASADGKTPGPGSYNDGTCKGGNGGTAGAAFAGGGGGGFGTAGGKGGTATSDDGTGAAGAAGTVTGNPLLTPLRGGCDGGGGASITTSSAGGGGAIQLVSRTKITITGVVAANGSTDLALGGGSGGGILLEAPVIEILGSVVANGGGGASGCLNPDGAAESGRLDATPARGGMGCDTNNSDGGRGAAGSLSAGDGLTVRVMGTRVAFAGDGGGGVGRIRINTAPGGIRRAGLFSPDPSTGTVGTR